MVILYIMENRYLIILPQSPMIIKSPSKRVSHLNLKFLDLKIMSIQSSPSSQTAPLPLPNPTPKKPHTLDINPQARTPSYHCHKPSHSKSQFDQSTTIDPQHQSSLLSDQPGTSTAQVLNYLSVDSEALYRELGRARAGRDRVGDESGKKRELELYQGEIRRIQKENQLIHKQILKIYSDKADDKTQTKNVRNMRILKHNSSETKQKKNPLQQHYEEMSSSFRYKSEDKEIDNLKKGFFDKFKKSQELGSEDGGMGVGVGSGSNLENQDVLKRDKLRKIVKKKLSKEGKQDGKKTSLPSLMGNKYENFYEDLYRHEKKRKGMSQAESQKLEQLKKKLLNSNFNTNFETHLRKLQLRVPEFLKNLR